jgi:hypothetical protein
MKHLILILTLILAQFKSFTQIGNTLKDTNVVWAAEFTTTYYVENLGRLKTKFTALGITDVRTIKIFDPNNTILDEDYPLSSKILDEAEKSDSSFIVYTDSECTVPINVEEAAGCIFKKIDPITKEEKLIISTHCNPHIQSGDYKARQVLSYNKIKHQFQLNTLAVGLLTDTTEVNSVYIGNTDFFWFKPQDILGKTVSYNDSNITVIKRLKSGGNSPSFESGFKILKNNIGDIRSFVLTDLKKHSTIPLFNSDLEQLTNAERATLWNPLMTLFSRDSIMNKITVDSANTVKNKQKTTTDKNDEFPDFSLYEKNFQQKEWFQMPRDFGVNYETITKMRLIQEWYWDERVKNLQIRLIGVSFVEQVSDFAHWFDYDRSVFYMKY